MEDSDDEYKPIDYESLRLKIGNYEYKHNEEVWVLFGHDKKLFSNAKHVEYAEWKTAKLVYKTYNTYHPISPSNWYIQDFWCVTRSVESMNAIRPMNWEEVNKAKGIMTFEEYIPLARRTRNDLGERRANLAHMALGIGTEILELQAAIRNNDDHNIREELSDLSWFSGNAMDLLNEKYSKHQMMMLTTGLHPKDGDTSMNDLADQCCVVVDLIKKHVAYGQPIINDFDPDWFERLQQWWWLKVKNKKYIIKARLSLELYKLVSYLNTASRDLGYQYSDILTYNIEKLKKRYPAGYSDFNAAERIDKNEQKQEESKETDS